VNEEKGNGQERGRVDEQHRPAEQQGLPVMATTDAT
jgi:hypothetical protein